jgi:hypothetical protein
MLSQPVTSATHPIHLSWIWELDAGGALATSFCPGKRVPAAQARRAWHRSLAEDLQRLKSDFCITTIACLLNDAELRVRCYLLNTAVDNLYSSAFGRAVTVCTWPA